MKPTTKKRLTLGRETVRVLSASNLRRANGGMMMETVTCEPWEGGGGGSGSGDASATITTSTITITIVPVTILGWQLSVKYC